MPPSPVAHRSAALAQEVHEAIQPADVTRWVAGESDVGERVYDLVRCRALAFQMSDVVLRRTRVDAESAGVGLRARGTVVVRSGWYAAWPPYEEVERLLPPIGEGDEMVVEAVRPVRKRTKVPKHFAEASLLRELEKVASREGAVLVQGAFDLRRLPTCFPSSRILGNSESRIEERR